MNLFQEENSKVALFIDLIKLLKDRRRTNRGNIRHSLQEIFFLPLSATVSGCDTWELIEEFGKLKLAWLRKYYPYKYGTPSRDTLGLFLVLLTVKPLPNYIWSISKD